MQRSMCGSSVYQRQQGDIAHCVAQDDAAAWERQVYTFAQHRQLPVLAPHIPIGIMAPTLRRQAYEMVRSPIAAALADILCWYAPVVALARLMNMQ
jgi:hypothetical protein